MNCQNEFEYTDPGKKYNIRMCTTLKANSFIAMLEQSEISMSEQASAFAYHERSCPTSITIKLCSDSILMLELYMCMFINF